LPARIGSVVGVYSKQVLCCPASKNPIRNKSNIFGTGVESRRDLFLRNL
jgi:hypothetical protein